MAESIVEQIIAQVKTDLEAITGDNGTTYWYTPGKVIRVDYFDSKNHFRTGYGDYIYMIRDTVDEDEAPRAAAMGGMADLFDLYILLAARDTRGNEDPFKATTAAGTIRNRMIHDVRKKLETDHTRGGLALDTRFHERRDFVEPDGWIVGEVQCVITYTHTRGSP